MKHSIIYLGLVLTLPTHAIELINDQHSTTQISYNDGVCRQGMKAQLNQASNTAPHLIGAALPAIPALKSLYNSVTKKPSNTFTPNYEPTSSLKSPECPPIDIGNSTHTHSGNQFSVTCNTPPFKWRIDSQKWGIEKQTINEDKFLPREKNSRYTSYTYNFIVGEDFTSNNEKLFVRCGAN